MLIVTGTMKKALLVISLLLVSAPLFAQSQEFILMFGGARRQASSSDRRESTLQTDNFDLGGSVREVSWGMELEPGTMFRIKGGAFDSAVRFHNPDFTTNPAANTPCTDNAPTTCRNLPFVNGTVTHVEAIIDYRFNEAFGTTGLFAGAGLYRQRGNSPTAYPVGTAVASTASMDETKWGASVGVDSNFPMTRTIGLYLEGTYHFINFRDHARAITATAGLRFAF
jgi:hypothetical protein